MMFFSPTCYIITLAALAYCNLVAPITAVAYTYTWQTNVPQRMQWDNNYGYCGGITIQLNTFEKVILF